MTNQEAIRLFEGRIVHHVIRDIELTIHIKSEEDIEPLCDFIKQNLADKIQQPTQDHLSQMQLRNPTVEIGPVELSQELLTKPKGKDVLNIIFQSNNIIRTIPEVNTIDDLLTRKLMSFVSYRKESKKLLMTMHPSILAKFTDEQASKVKFGALVTAFEKLYSPSNVIFALNTGICRVRDVHTGITHPYAPAAQDHIEPQSAKKRNTSAPTAPAVTEHQKTADHTREHAQSSSIKSRRPSNGPTIKELRPAMPKHINLYSVCNPYFLQHHHRCKYNTNCRKEGF